MHQPTKATSPTNRSRMPWVGWFVGPVFLLLALWFIFEPSGIDTPIQAPVIFDHAALSTAARRTPLSDPPTINIDGFDRTCMSCHRMFPVREIAPDKLLQHRHIVLNHGINNRCHNCHDGENRNLLVLRDGTTIGYTQVVQLCSQCHGPTYRDWERGAHGRTNGYWDKARGEVRRLGCTECHNPHQPRVPAMDPLAPLPGPRALRAPMTDVHDEHVALSRDPLRRQASKGHVEVAVDHNPADQPIEYLPEEDE
jgi:hypothetical protein